MVMAALRASPVDPREVMAALDVIPDPEIPAVSIVELGMIGGGRLAAPAVACPYCGSLRTTLENVFGPTQCRSIRHCAECRQPFEAFKPI